jgi:hypothetical protein
MDQTEIIIIIEKKYHKFDLKDKIKSHKNFDKREKKKNKSRKTESKYLIYTN